MMVMLKKQEKGMKFELVRKKDMIETVLKYGRGENDKGPGVKV